MSVSAHTITGSTIHVEVFRICSQRFVTASPPSPSLTYQSTY